MSGPMTPTAKHRETAAAVATKAIGGCMFETAENWTAEKDWATEVIATALAKAEREGMKRAAEIAAGWQVTACGDDYQYDGGQYWDAGSVYDQGRFDASQRILSEVGEG